MQVQIESSWAQRLQSEFDAPYFQQLTDFVRSEYRQTTCYPPGPKYSMPSTFVRLNKPRLCSSGRTPITDPDRPKDFAFR